MRTAIGACAALLWAALILPPASTAEAGFLMTFSGSGDDTPARMSIEKHALRIEEGQNAAIYRRDKNLLWSLSSQERTYTELTPQEAERMGQQMGAAMEKLREQMKDLSPEERKLMEGMMGSALKKESTPVQVEYRKIAAGVRSGKWTCDRYELMVNGKKEAELCFARAAAIGLDPEESKTLEAFFHFMARTTKRMGASVFGLKVQGAAQEPPGIPVETISFSEGRSSDRMEIKEVGRKDFPPSLFEVPEGYQKQEMAPAK